MKKDIEHATRRPKALTPQDWHDYHHNMSIIREGKPRLLAFLALTPSEQFLALLDEGVPPFEAGQAIAILREGDAP